MRVAVEIAALEAAEGPGGKARAARLDDGTLPGPAETLSDGTTVVEPLYTVYFPQGTTVSLPSGGGQSAQAP